MLKENLGLKDSLEERGFDVKGNTVNLKEVYSVFSRDGEDVDMEEVVDESSDAD